jgi:site-specific recombinase XerC
MNNIDHRTTFGMHIARLPDAEFTGRTAAGLARLELVERLSAFIDTLKSRDLSRSSRRVYVSRATQFLTFVRRMPDHAFQSTDPATAFLYVYKHFLIELSFGRGCTQLTLANYESFGRMFLSYCRWHLAALPKIARSAQEADQHTNERSRKYLEYVCRYASRRDKALIHLMLIPQLKIEQVLRLPIGAVSIDPAGIVTVTIEDNSLFQAAFTAAGLACIAHWLQRRSADAVDETIEFLFPGLGGKPLARSTCDHIVRKYGWKSGVLTCIRSIRKATPSY